MNIKLGPVASYMCMCMHIKVIIHVLLIVLIIIYYIV